MATFSIIKLIRLKRTWRVLASLCLVAAVQQVQAQFNYSVQNGTITITKYTGPIGNVTIPNQINYLPVTAIGEDAFYGSSVTGVTIPDTVTTIGDYAFFECSGLTNACVGNSVASIGQSAFENCASLTKVMFGNNVADISSYAFAASGLTSVTIPDSGTTIGEGAFSACNLLTNVSIGSSVTNVGEFAFELCLHETAYIVDPANTSYCSVDGVLFDKLRTTLIQYPDGATGGYTIPNGVTSVEDLAFFFSSLTSVTIPSSITNIGRDAFYACSKLTDAYFQGSAPANGSTIFGDDSTIVYYLPGTLGWSTNYSGRPTALWTLPNPMILNGSVGVQSNQFNFTVSWATNSSVTVEACTDLSNPVWQPLQTNSLTATPDGGWFTFTDPQWTNYPARFYRLATQ